MICKKNFLNTYRFWSAAIICSTLVFLASCTPKGCMDESCSNYDAEAEKDDGSCICDDSLTVDMNSMLTQYSENIILPTYNELAAKLDSLELEAAALDTSNVSSIRPLLLRAYKQWAKASFFEFGPAEQALLRVNLNTFPTDTALIISNVLEGDYSLALVSNFQAKGFPAMDYIVNKNSTITALEKKYLMDLIADSKSVLSVVIGNWNVSYAAEFPNKLGTDAASSISNLVNALNLEIDMIKNTKVGIPLGKKTYGDKMPNDVEGYFGSWSFALLDASLNGLETVINGDTLGFKEYLDTQGSMYDGELLSVAIQNQIHYVRDLQEAFSGDLPDAIRNNESDVDVLHSAWVDLLFLTKTEMPAAVEVLINYQSGDGD